MATAKKSKKPAPAKKAQEPKKRGRPTDYTLAVADAICLRLAAGESLRGICENESMPHRDTVRKWLLHRPEFVAQYARAREDQADFYAEQIVEIADEEVTMVKRSKHQYGAKPEDDTDENEVEVAFDAAAVARNRLRVDARKWYASKLAPKKYGDKTTLAGDPENPLQVSLLEQIATNPKSRLTV